MTTPIAAVMARISEIERRFTPARPATAADPSADGFQAAYDLASAEYPSGAAAATPGTAWSGVGSSGWVVPGSAGVTAPRPAPGVEVGYTPGPTSGVAPTSLATGVTPTGELPADTPFAAEFETAATKYGVPVELLAAVGYVESRYQTGAVSTAGAQGVMQLMPFVSEAYGVNPFDPAQAIDAGARILSEHYRRFGSWDLALAAYNAGAGTVARAGNQIPSEGVAGYVAAVNQRIEQM